MKKVFISYSSKNFDIADKICTYLEEHGKECWIAPRNIPIGTEYGEEIIKGLESSSVVVLIFSEYSNQSQHVLREVERAVSKNIPIISYRVDQAELTKSMEYFLLTNQWLDATKEPSKMLSKLDHGISELFGEKSEAAIYEDEKIPEKVEEGKKYKKPIIAVASLGALIVATVLVVQVFGGKKSTDVEEGTSKETYLVSESNSIVAADETPEAKEEAIDTKSTENTTTSDELETSLEGEMEDATEPAPTMAVDESIESPWENTTPQETSESESTPTVTEAPVKVEKTEEHTEKSVTQEPMPEEKKDKEPKEEKEQESKETKPEKDQKETKKETKQDTTKDEEKEEEKMEDVVNEPEVAKFDVVAGEYITFGKYQPVGSTSGDGAIVWQVLDVDDATKQVRLIAEQILDIKPFDCADSGKYDVSADGEKYDRSKLDEYSKEQLNQFRGNGNWEKSDLRAWLNAEENVKYPGVEPTDAGTDEYGNAFNNQKGFLNRFTKAEKKLIEATQLEDGTTNKVYLLSMDEVKKYEKTDYFQIHPSITEAAAASDTTSWYATYKANGATDYIWATRTMSENYPQQIYVVNSAVGKETFIERNAAAAGHGIRPVLSISLDGMKLDGEGSSSNPYQIIFE